MLDRSLRGVAREAQDRAGKSVFQCRAANSVRRLDMTIENVAVKAPLSLGIVERHHAPLRESYLKMKKELPSEPPSFLLAMNTKARNDSVVAAGLCPTLLVYGTMSRLVTGSATLSRPRS